MAYTPESFQKIRTKQNVHVGGPIMHCKTSWVDHIPIKLLHLQILYCYKWEIFFTAQNLLAQNTLVRFGGTYLAV